MKRKNIFWGLFFIISAVLIILNQFDLLPSINIFKLMITLLLIPVILYSIKIRCFSTAIFSLAIICIMFDEVLGIENLTPWPILGVALFLSIGLSFIFPHKHTDGSVHYEKNWQNEASEDSDENVNLAFGGISKYINSQNLKKVNVNCKFGGAKIFFDKAEIEGNEAIMNVDIDFCGIEMYVPKAWAVKKDVDFIIGGIDEKGLKGQSTGGKVLTIKGRAKFAGITIIYI